MEALMHLLGICSDHPIHYNLMDYVAYNWTYVTDVIKFLKMKLAFFIKKV